MTQGDLKLFRLPVIFGCAFLSVETVILQVRDRKYYTHVMKS